MTTNNSLECRYLGWGNLDKFQQMSLADNQALIYTVLADRSPVLIRGFLDCIRSEEVIQRVPQRFSVNDLVEVMVGMVRSLPDSLLQEFHQFSTNTYRASNDDQPVVCAVISW
ncbi:hypothetical protein Sta7437_4681 (plasmid) [Stanieria cyanosphaera PCC 7437]|uniref:Uncharacterized protein n=1 Tax=Stanieria cyanosphaera (strain ATCC 29371 / PCC 7437) TaxID=111780 RepID=K9XZX2_STAC7|nr:hypothetical protein [Stanieria cyanosphaera]AFZ38135.1 hypothetical protein Sta7437_4681 [Stanieria cyanosphaera PCC 7437]